MVNSVILRECFDGVGSEKSGSVNADQLQSALAIGNLEFPLSVVHQMIRVYDFDRNGNMSFGGSTSLCRNGKKMWIYLVADDAYKVGAGIGIIMIFLSKSLFSVERNYI